MCMVSRSAGLKFVDLDIDKLSPPPGRFPVGDPSYDWDIADGYIVSHLDTLLFPEVLLWFSSPSHSVFDRWADR